MVIVSGTVAIKPERRNEAVQAALTVAAATQQEEGCICYDFYADLADANRFRVYEEWESEAALMAHLQQAHTQEFLAGLGELIVSPPDVKKYIIASGGPLF